MARLKRLNPSSPSESLRCRARPRLPPRGNGIKPGALSWVPSPRPCCTLRQPSARVPRRPPSAPVMPDTGLKIASFSLSGPWHGRYKQRPPALGTGAQVCISPVAHPMMLVGAEARRKRQSMGFSLRLGGL
ncbi:hypothetical protein CDD82_7367 [Ophiocordyceps australis]|uniref:Uncharacterized protein n=1 Tax=Ophiocordyceps australis TaxID=1399860 RepID=A0A2C5ZQ72_9HYPO|nr:hypothetical protein CDD82_7367 [Ophiocordyceps australis]